MSDKTIDREILTTRRTLVGGIVGLGVGAPLLVACGSDSESSAGGSSDAGSGSSSGATDSGGSSSSSGGSGIAKTSDIPEGSGKIFADDKVVITQPTAGEFKAFDYTCTHQGCPVTKISGEDIECTCHGSKFSITDGSVVDGPANEPLAEKTVTVTGEEISVS